MKKITILNVAIFILIILGLLLFPIRATAVESFTTRVDYTVGDGPHDLFLADLNGDGNDDIVTANYYSGSVSVLLNDGDGGFADKVDYSIDADPRSLLLADIGEDDSSDLDIITANYQEDTVTILTNNGNGVFSIEANYTVGKGPFEIFLADIGEDSDNDLDIITANADENKISILKNNGDGTFTAGKRYRTGNEPKGIFLADLNGDGYRDIVTNNWADYTVSVLINYGNATFKKNVTYPVGGGPRSIFITDLDGDTDEDIITANQFDNNVTVLLNRGNGTYAAGVNYAVGYGPLSVYAADIDKDDDMDIVTANLIEDTVSILINNGDGTFSPQLERSVGDGPYSVFLADIDEYPDNDMNIITANNNADSVTILISNIPPVITLQEPDGVEDTVKVNTSYTIKWTDDDPDDDASIILYYLRAGDLINEQLEIATDINEDDDEDNYAWSITDIPEGDYIIIAVINDRYNSYVSSSAGFVTIEGVNDTNTSEPDDYENGIVPPDDTNGPESEDDEDSMLQNYLWYIIIIIIIVCLLLGFLLIMKRKRKPEESEKATEDEEQ
ncbi:MAG: VCBS repeat-containing protein [Thermoplasmata archaeon]|nr:VCBS repeat-containing protein [Thermoplasmata archaeon]